LAAARILKQDVEIAIPVETAGSDRLHLVPGLTLESAPAGYVRRQPR
jgi:hypothetical protein